MATLQKKSRTSRHVGRSVERIRSRSRFITQVSRRYASWGTGISVENISTRSGTTLAFFALFSSNSGGPETPPAPRSRLLSDPRGPFCAQKPFRSVDFTAPDGKSLKSSSFARAQPFDGAARRVLGRPHCASLKVRPSAASLAHFSKYWGRPSRSATASPGTLVRGEIGSGQIAHQAPYDRRTREPAREETRYEE